MRKLIISGRYAKGLGRGRYFMRQKGYKRQFIKRLGINPYHGTLNVKLSGKDLKKLDRIRSIDGIFIKGFRKGGTDFGDVVCYRASVSGIKCALVVPKRSTHRDVAEIISEEMLRKKLGIKEGGRVRISISF